MGSLPTGVGGAAAVQEAGSSGTSFLQINKLNYEGHSNGTVLTLIELG